MGSIYQNALLTIGAVSSPTSSEGCFINNSWPDICLLLSKDLGQSYLIGARVLDGKGQCISKEDINRQYPLFTRGWVFQERLLSTRFLHCNYGELVFECLDSTHCECKSKIAPHPSQKSANAIRNINFTTQRRLLGEGKGEKQGQTLQYWKFVVQNYMELGLTYPSDVLPAIGGCAQLLAASLGLTYTAGLWKELLETDLLWHVRQGCSVKKSRPAGSTAPSWSWASVAMEQSITHIEGDKGLWQTSDKLLRNKITEVYCEPKSTTNPFGELQSAYLKLDVALYPWYIRTVCTSAKFGKTGNGRYLTRDLHIERHKIKVYCCTSHIKELVVDDAMVEVMLDVNLRSEGLMEERLSGCQNSKPPYCTLAPIYLLPVMHKESLPRALDVLLILMRTPPVGGKPNCFKRIGLVKVMNERADIRTWESMALDRIQPANEEIWLF
ncbi:hypothetical protein GQ44DRAFT_708890 [Phaeosphaeriaceae sp. PMI808]|nr:hypothetical protein GQ44DRAFT_708890 [Phaeosphaeriaceae sp. PMI808]